MQIQLKPFLFCIFIWIINSMKNNVLRSHQPLYDNLILSPILYCDNIEDNSHIESSGYDERFPKEEDLQLNTSLFANILKLKKIQYLESLSYLPEEKKLDAIKNILDEYNKTYPPFCISNGGLYKNWLLEHW